MNNNKGVSLVELIIVIAILGIFGTAVFSLFVVGTRSYRNVGNDSDIQNEAQLTANQIENLLIDTTKAITYSYTAGGSTTKVLSDNGVGEVDSKTITVYNTDSIYIIDWIKSDKKIFLQKKEVDNTGQVTNTGNREVMAEKVINFSASLEKAQSKNKVFIEIQFESSDGTSGYLASKQIALRNVLAINDTSNIYDEQEQPAAVTGIQIFYDGQNCTEDTVSYFASGEQELSFSFSALVRGVNFPSQNVTWAVSGNSSAETTISDTGRLVLGADENLANTLRVTVTSAANNDFTTWANVKIKKVNGLNVAIQGDNSSREYHYGDVIIVNANLSGDNLEDTDKQFRWTSTGAQRLNTYPDTSSVQEYKITATVGNSFSISATSVADSNFTDTVSHEVNNPYGVTIAWEVNQNYWMKRNDTSNNLVATVEPNDGGYGDIKWEICWIENKATHQPLTDTLSSKSYRDDKISLSSYRGQKTSIYCGKNIDWNTEYSVGVRAYIEINGQKIYSEPKYVGIDKVFIRVWDSNNNSQDVYSGTEDAGMVRWVNDNSKMKYTFEVYNYNCTPGTITIEGENPNYVKNLSFNDNSLQFDIPWVFWSYPQKEYNAKVKININGITRCYIHSKFKK